MIKVKEVHPLFRFLDQLMVPLMWALSGFKNDSPQETHHWHMMDIDPNIVPDSAGVRVMGNDKSRFRGRSFGLNHIPILGGWTKYITLEANDFNKYWNVGWKVTFLDRKKGEICEIHRLKICEARIKLFKGINDSEKVFFGLNESGKFVKLKIVGEGSLGDNKFNKTRLF